MERARNSPDVTVHIITASSLSSESMRSSDVGRGAGGVQAVARYVRRASSRCLMREPSVVRETSAGHRRAGERQPDWEYSRPVLVLELIWNLAVVVATFVVLVQSMEERPGPPLRIWIVGHAFQCILHMLLKFYVYRWNCHHWSNARVSLSSSTSARSALDTEFYSRTELEEQEGISDHSSMAKCLVSTNIVLSAVWWNVGYFWYRGGGRALEHDAPRLYWLCVVLLGSKAVFVILSLIVVSCCLPFIIITLYKARPERAYEKDINSLPKYKFRQTGRHDGPVGNKSEGGVMSLVGPLEKAKERVLSAEDAECCICISTYDNDVELRELPCTHHFHCTCVDKWLRVNATCPLCKHNIIHVNGNGNGSRREGV